MRRFIVLALAVALICSALAAAEDPLIGRWKGWIRAGDETILTVDFVRSGDTVQATFDALVEGKNVRGTFKVLRDGDRLSLETTGAGSICEGKLIGNVIAGDYTNRRTGSKGTFRLERGSPSSQDEKTAGAVSGTLRELTIPAPSLRGNLLGDPVEQSAAVYLPPSYASGPNRRFPVLYLLHGIGGSYKDFSEHWPVPALMDKLIAQHRVGEFIVVMPNGANRYIGSFYANSPVTGGWQDYITRDLIAFIDQNFRTRADARSRAIAGHSMGGLGAILAAMQRPDVFASAYAISPCCLANVEDLSYGNQAFRTALGIKTLQDLDNTLASGDFYPVAIIAHSAAFFPAPDKPPLFVEMPVKIERGEVMPNSKYDQWIEQFPIRQVSRHRAALAKLRGLHLEFGIDDQFAHVPVATREFSARLAELRIPHTLAVHSGDHRSQMLERLEHVILPTIASDLSD